MSRRTFFFLMTVSTSLFFSNVSLSFGENQGNLQIAQVPAVPQQSGQQSAQSDSNPNNNLYTNNRKLGLGLTWMPANNAIYSGFVDLRYWVNRWFGIEGGVGLIHSSFDGSNNLSGVTQNTYQLTTFQIQAMVPIVERRHFVFYGDLDFVPEVGAPSFGYALLPGLGLEYALPEYPNLSAYLQINPILLGGNPFGKPYNVISLPVDIGFHYYF